REARLTIRPAPMHDLFEMAHERQHGEHRLDEQTVLPRAARTQCERARIALGGMAGGLTQDNHLVFTLPHSPLQGGIRDMRGGTRPPPPPPPPTPRHPPPPPPPPHHAPPRAAPRAG